MKNKYFKLLHNLEVYNSIMEKCKKSGLRALCLCLSVLTAGTVFVGAKKVENHDKVENNGVTYLANDTSKKFKVAVGINIYIDDKLYTPTDVNGNEVFPFILDGTTNIALRAILTPFGIRFNWVQDTKTVQIFTDKACSPNFEVSTKKNTAITYKEIVSDTDIKIEVDGKPFVPTNINGEIVQVHNYGGTIYMPFSGFFRQLGLPVAWEQSTHSVFIGSHNQKVDNQPNNPNQGSTEDDIPLDQQLADLKVYIDYLTPYFPKLRERLNVIEMANIEVGKVYDTFDFDVFYTPSPEIEAYTERFLELSGQQFEDKKRLLLYDFEFELPYIYSIYDKYNKGQSLTQEEINSIYVQYNFSKEEYEYIDTFLTTITDESLAKRKNEMLSLLSKIKSSLGYKSSKSNVNFPLDIICYSNYTNGFPKS